MRRDCTVAWVKTLCRVSAQSGLGTSRPSLQPEPIGFAPRRNGVHQILDSSSNFWLNSIKWWRGKAERGTFPPVARPDTPTCKSFPSSLLALAPSWRTVWILNPEIAFTKVA